MELKDAIAQTSAQLKISDTMISLAVDKPGTIVPNQCYKTWQQRSKYHQYLFETLQLLPLRQAAFDIMEKVNDAAQEASGTGIFDFKYFDMPITFTSARFLSLQNYISTTWAIYDKLANVCARIIGPVSIGNNPYSTHSAKLCNSFFTSKSDKKTADQDNDKTADKKNNDRPDGFALQTILDNQWAWPAKISYKIRNLILHEGVGGVEGEFFLGDTPLHGFKICEHLKNVLQKECISQPKKDEDSYVCLSRLASDDDFPWYGDDIRIILKKYHSEIDALYVILLQWGIHAFCDQVKLFTEPDMKFFAR